MVDLAPTTPEESRAFRASFAPEYAEDHVRIEVNDAPVGEVWFGYQRAGTRLSCHLPWIRVDASHPRRGIATQVLGQVEIEARGPWPAAWPSISSRATRPRPRSAAGGGIVARPRSW